jgi:Xaa-Pro aminopeptidase
MTLPFIARRRHVLDTISPGAMLIFSAPVMVRNNDVEHEYRQDSDFYYLTGFDEPESALLLKSGPDSRVIAFVRERDPERETWDGPRLGVERAVEALGVDEAFPISALSAKLGEALAGCEHLYFPIGQNSAADELVLSTLRRLRSTIRRGGVWPTTITEPGTILHEMRLRKDAGELTALERAIEVTEQAHRAVFATTRVGQWEYELEAVLRSEFRRSGAERVAYSPIVASGINATILHHRSNNRQSKPGELILVDAGCEYGYQSADITRTFPVSGKYTRLQRAAYDIVLAAQEKAIHEVKPDATMDTVHDVAVRELIAGLIELGIIKDNLETSLANGSYKKYYMHRTSHWLGMDVHDVGAYHVSGKPRPFAPNMVLTVEPGLYFPNSDESVPDELRGTGIRIEDDILVTTTGFTNLSKNIPKHPDEIESIMLQGQGSHS